MTTSNADMPAPARSYRVLMIAPTSFFADYGCHVRILEEAQILQQLGHKVTILTYHNGSDVPGLDIQRGLPVPWRQNYEVGSSRHKIGLDALLGLKTLELLSRDRFDVIHAHLHEGALLGRVLGGLFGVPMVFDFQGSMTEEMLDHHFLRRESCMFAPLRRLESWLDSRRADDHHEFRPCASRAPPAVRLRARTHTDHARLRQHRGVRACVALLAR